MVKFRKLRVWRLFGSSVHPHTGGSPKLNNSENYLMDIKGGASHLTNSNLILINIGFFANVL